MLFMRSALSNLFFPKMLVLYLLAYHFYLLGDKTFPCGYYNLAVLSMTFASFHLMGYCLLCLESPCLQKGRLSFQCPREVYCISNIWPTTSDSLPDSWTIFGTLNARYIPINDREFEGDEDDEEEEEEEVHQGEVNNEEEVEG